MSFPTGAKDDVRKGETNGSSNFFRVRAKATPTPGKSSAESPPTTRRSSFSGMFRAACRESNQQTSTSVKFFSRNKRSKTRTLSLSCAAPSAPPPGPGRAAAFRLETYAAEPRRLRSFSAPPDARHLTPLAPPFRLGGQEGNDDGGGPQRRRRVDDGACADSERDVYTRFMKSHKCYDIVPTSSKLVVFDTTLQVTVPGSPDAVDLSRLSRVIAKAAFCRGLPDRPVAISPTSETAHATDGHFCRRNVDHHRLHQHLDQILQVPHGSDLRAGGTQDRDVERSLPAGDLQASRPHLAGRQHLRRGAVAHPEQDPPSSRHRPLHWQRALHPDAQTHPEVLAALSVRDAQTRLHEEDAGGSGRGHVRRHRLHPPGHAPHRRTVRLQASPRLRPARRQSPWPSGGHLLQVRRHREYSRRTSFGRGRSPFAVCSSELGGGENLRRPGRDGHAGAPAPLPALRGSHEVQQDGDARDHRGPHRQGRGSQVGGGGPPVSYRGHRVLVGHPSSARLES
ncbi:uncharacterized protein LOC133492395 isoform X3 [Syngnathoides biaculeatus]|uniref:uncharacterized protein LOC133492395 isoform X3 n=1 Tax=Syngnathoides biaculeatus TaxID=300417 RepID=UPI002ADDE988|nr:uncharacterized protein LOC133492395 isoform X3 [Syngnathoides biaculeatus]